MTPMDSYHQELSLVNESVSSGTLQKIFYEGVEVGFVSYLPLILTNTSILEDLDSDEAEVMYPLFFRLQFDRGYYLSELEIKREFRSQGIGEKVVRLLQKRWDTPILIYSLATAEEFWEKLGFKKIESYYYTWEPS